MSKKSKAQFKYIRISPLKLRRVVNLVRGKDCLYSLSLLQSMPNKGARIVEKILTSAMASAKNNLNAKDDSLFVSEILVDGAGMLKRFRAQSRGRGAPIKKRMSHLTVSIEEK